MPGSTHSRRRQAPLEPPTAARERRRSSAQGTSAGDVGGVGTLLGAVVSGARLTVRLMLDRRVPATDRLAVLGALLYLVSPIDLIADVIPVLGQLDDIGIVVFAWRRLLHGAGEELIEERWTGSAASLRLVLMLAGLPGGHEQVA